MNNDREARESQKARYRDICDTEPSIPLFLRSWWLDALCGPDSWGVAVSEQDGEVVGALPYRLTKPFGFTYLGLPVLTAGLGPWVKARDLKPAQSVSYETAILSALADGLPPFDLYRQNWHKGATNWMPFYWQGYSQTTYYTYVIESLADENVLWSNLRDNIRGDIKKAKTRFGVSVKTDLDANAFLDLNRKTFDRQNKAMPYTNALVQRLDAACAQRNCRAIVIGEDGDGKRHAGAYIVWDEKCAYYIMGGGDPSLRNSGATSLCMWEAIRTAARHTKQFDFEGSVSEPIERYFRAFGGVLKPVFFVQKKSSRLLSSAMAVRTLLGR